MLHLGLIEAQKMGINRVLISADEDNPASWRTIEQCGGVLEKVIKKDEKLLKVYWIDLALHSGLDPIKNKLKKSPSNESPPLSPKKLSRKEIQAKARAEKAKAKLARKAAFRHKTEKKLKEKEERKVYHKKENTQKKFQKKLEKKKF
jgi:hypothetical protein